MITKYSERDLTSLAKKSLREYKKSNPLASEAKFVYWEIVITDHVTLFVHYEIGAGYNWLNIAI
jgi:hypothetical protein